MFALHYAHEYYDDERRPWRPHGVPGAATREPDYWDFMYFSFVVGMCVAGLRRGRRAASRSGARSLAHGVVSFVFNVSAARPDGEYRRERDIVRP